MNKDYKRWTDKEHKYKGCVDCTYRNCQQCDDIVDFEKEAYNRLCDFEDKLENGTLVELPFIQQPHQGIWEVFFFNTRINGVMYYLFFDKAEAEAKLRELKGERQ